MAKKKKKEVKKSLVEKYQERLKKELGGKKEVTPSRVTSVEYEQFKESFLPQHLSLYEKGCQLAGKIIQIKVKGEQEKKLKNALEVCHLDITPNGAISFSFLLPILIIFFGSLISYFLLNNLFFVFLFVVGGLASIIALQKLPYFLANNWRLKASNQMVLSIFYVVTYMRHTSNIERAIQFASDHLAPPLSLDFKKVLWNVETGQYETVKDSLENYLKGWKQWNPEFIEAFHLIESSLYEPSESRRLDLLDKSLDLILKETYENMLHYAHNLKSPMTMLHMLGIILPILGLVVLPLVVSFMTSAETSPATLAIYIALIYNVGLPIGVYYLGKIILSKRPSGYGDTDISKLNPNLKKYKNFIIKLGKKEIKINPLFISIIIFLVLFIIGIIPMVYHFADPTYDFSFDEQNQFRMFENVCPQGQQTCQPEEMVGPYGIGASFLSFFVTLSIALGFGSYFALRSKNVIKIRNETKKLEDEFASSLFQLGNKLGDGLPAEIAFQRVAETTTGSRTGKFFNLVAHNVSRMGMSVQEAIFNPKTGAILMFPSKVIESSMKVLIQSVKKGPKVAAQALINVSRYIKEMHRIDERLKDLLADIISSMTSQINFLTPAISGIVIGITSMITTILSRLSSQLQTFAEGQSSQLGGMTGILSLFGNGIPTYYFQIIVGLYVVELIFILTILSNGIQNGFDKLNERYLLGKNLIKSTLIYVVISAAVVIIFNFIALTIMSNAL